MHGIKALDTTDLSAHNIKYLFVALWKQTCGLPLPLVHLFMTVKHLLSIFFDNTFYLLNIEVASI